jgi:hypothetical protein
LKQPPEASKFELGADHLEDSVSWTDQKTVEIPIYDKAGEHVKTAGQTLAYSERHMDDAKAEGYLVEIPALNLPESLEQEVKTSKYREGNEKLTERH